MSALRRSLQWRPFASGTFGEWRRRAASIGIVEPDASILLRGLDRITGTVVRGNPELSFRVSLIRSTLQIDVCPSATSITSFVQHLQAEMEQQARLGAVKSGGDEAAVLKSLEPSRGSGSPTNATTPPPPPPPTSSTTPKPTSNLCRWFASDKGCRRGNGCKYPHTWSLVDKTARQKKCLNCGGQGHRQKNARLLVVVPLLRREAPRQCRWVPATLRLLRDLLRLLKLPGG